MDNLNRKMEEARAVVNIERVQMALEPIESWLNKRVNAVYFLQDEIETGCNEMIKVLRKEKFCQEALQILNEIRDSL